MSPLRGRGGRVGCGLLVTVLVTAVCGASSWQPSAQAAFPGANGLIAFQREAVAGDHTQTDILTARPDGTGVVALTHTPALNEFGPAWSPAGDRLAFWRTPAPFGPGSLWVMGADGSGAVRLTTGIDARDAAWNPAGTRLVYDLASADLYTLSAADGSDRRRLTSGPALDFEPAWSPGGRLIAFTRGRQQGDPGNIYVIDRVTLQLTQVTSSPAYDHQVAWSPDGTQLVFERDAGDKSAIYSVKPDGTALHRLTPGPHFDTGPAFAPDGGFIVFGSDRAGTLGDLWLMRADGTHLHQLVARTNPTGFPDWQPVPTSR